jgi:hypothetical protein
VTIPESPDEHPPGDDTALLIAALNHSWAWYDAGYNRGLQVINYFLVAIAVLATAYVSAINGKHYAIAVAIALSGAVLTVAAFMVGQRQRRRAAVGEVALAALQDRVADRLKIDSLRMVRSEIGRATRFFLPVRFAFGLALLLSIGSVLYALIH